MRSTIEWGKLHPSGLHLPMRWSPEALEDAYKRCGTITADYAKTFYLVSMPFSPRECNSAGDKPLHNRTGSD